MFIEENAADMGPYFSWALGGRTHRHAREPGLEVSVGCVFCMFHVGHE
jgi:hypothetical protein